MRNRMAVASLVMGIISIPMGFIPFLNFLNLLVGPAGMWFGWLAIRQIKRSETEMTGSGLALTGLLLSLSGTVITIMVLVVLFAVILP